jgi:hypothetical protein
MTRLKVSFSDPSVSRLSGTVFLNRRAAIWQRLSTTGLENVGTSTSPNPMYGPPQPVTEIFLPFFYHFHICDWRLIPATFTTTVGLNRMSQFLTNCGAHIASEMSEYLGVFVSNYSIDSFSAKHHGRLVLSYWLLATGFVSCPIFFVLLCYVSFDTINVPPSFSHVPLHPQCYRKICRRRRLILSPANNTYKQPIGNNGSHKTTYTIHRNKTALSFVT